MSRRSGIILRIGMEIGDSREWLSGQTVEFEHGSTEWHISMLADGKIESLNFRPN